MTTANTPLTIFPSMCKRQQDDIKSMLAAIDEFGATALALSGKSAQGYTTFIEARDSIRDKFEGTFKTYRLVEEA